MDMIGKQNVIKMKQLENYIGYGKSSINTKIIDDKFPPRFIQRPGYAVWLVQDIETYLRYSSGTDSNLLWSEYILKKEYKSKWFKYLILKKKQSSLTVFEFLVQEICPESWNKFNKKVVHPNLSIIEYMVQIKHPQLWNDHSRTRSSKLMLPLENFLNLLDGNDDE